MLEGCYARSGLLSDVELYEEFPATYGAEMSRRRRWIRGDWELAGWLLPRVPGPGPRRPPNPLSALSLWKLFDNLRRSLVPAALTLLLLAGWTMLPRPWLWTLLVCVVLILPSASAFLLELARKPDDVLLRQHVAGVTSGAMRGAAQTLLTLAFLPYEAMISLDAITRTTWRMLVTHRGLLEWNPAAADDSERRRLDETSGRSEFIASLKAMWIAPMLALATASMLAATAPATLTVAAPILLLWFVSPGIAWWISRPLARREAQLSAAQALFLRNLARRTWGFFEALVGPDDHWLPPDNMQEQPVATIAHRTSPTNIGLSLLANLAANDFGYVPAGQLLLRTANAFDTLLTMQRYEGHFYNWYDTRSLEPLPPLYVSTVDSGNLAGHLLTLRPGLLALVDEPVAALRWFEGMSDTLRIVVEHVGATVPESCIHLQQELESVFDSRPTTINAMLRWLERLEPSVVAVVTDVGAAAASLQEAPAADAAIGADNPSFWAEALARQWRNLRDEIRFLAPWSALPAPPLGLGEFVGMGDVPTLRGLAALDQDRLAAIEQRLRQDLPAADRVWLADLHTAVALASAACHRTHRDDRGVGRDLRGTGADGVRLPLRRCAPPAGDRL